MNASTLQQYQNLLRIDLALNSIKQAYPYTLNEQAKYTLHQVTLYQSNYCHSEQEQTKEQPSVTGGAPSIDVVFI